VSASRHSSTRSSNSIASACFTMLMRIVAASAIVSFSRLKCRSVQGRQPNV
jgi:hypothetical protein